MKSWKAIAIAAILLPLASTPTASAGEGYTECDITIGSAAGQMFSMFAVRVGGCFLDATSRFNDDITLHTPPGCTIFYDEDRDQIMDGEVTDHVEKFWDLYGYCDLPNLGTTIGITYRW